MEEGNVDLQTAINAPELEELGRCPKSCSGATRVRNVGCAGNFTSATLPTGSVVLVTSARPPPSGCGCAVGHHQDRTDVDASRPALANHSFFLQYQAFKKKLAPKCPNDTRRT
jgi:hypothetical protein